ncbi:MAG: tRNA guanosine(34) transglycosylase Tgt [Azospirillaceae bacterium]
MARYAGFGFEIAHRAADSQARTGRLATPHGSIETPNFIFCGTKAAIKGLTSEQMRAAGSDIILANTYHLMIQPGADRVQALGGLHRMMDWSGPMLTDSGGFQIFSMGHGGVADEIKGRGRGERPKSLVSIGEEGAAFRSYLNGEKLFLTPELSVDIQRKLGADLIVQLDECTPYHVGRDYIARSMELSMRWGDRSLAEFDRGDDGSQALYGIVQGGTDAELRRVSAEYTADRPFFATAIGGTLGGEKAQMYEVVAMAARHVHPERPVHLLGIGNFRDIFEGVALGMDTFDCVHPTRVARHGWALKKGAPNERVNLRNARFAEETGPIDETCGCATCQRHPAGYLHHLVRTGEPLALILVTRHNVFTMNRLMRDVRQAIAGDTLAEARAAWLVD